MSGEGRTSIPLPLSSSDVEIFDPRRRERGEERGRCTRLCAEGRWNEAKDTSPYRLDTNIHLFKSEVNMQNLHIRSVSVDSVEFGQNGD